MNDGRWTLETLDGLTVVKSALLGETPGVAHAFSTRLSDDGEFDVGPASAAGAPWGARRTRLAAATGLDGPLLAPRQVHGARVVGPTDFPGDAVPEADAVVAWDAGAPAVRTADCLPVLLAGSDGGIVAAVHAGWRGTAAGIVAAAVARIVEEGVAPERLIAALGPAIGACCYEVGEDVVAAVSRSTASTADAISRRGPGARPHLDLVAANRLQLRRAGLAPAAIEAAPWCTRCRGDLFWSYRRDGVEAGRMMACIGRAVGSP